MQNYASKYINITNMTSASGEELERLCLGSIGSPNPRIVKFHGHEYQILFVWLCDDSGQGELENCFMMFSDEKMPIQEPTVCSGVGGGLSFNERMFGKVVMSLRTDLDLEHLIPNLEPQFCLFAIEEFDIYDDEIFYQRYELCVREDHLHSPEGRHLGREVLQSKLKGEIV